MQHWPLFKKPGFDTLQGGPSELGAGTWTHVFGPRIVNELRASETRISFAFAPTPSALANPLYALPTLSIANIAPGSIGPNQNFPQGRSEDLYQLQDTVSITRGMQTLRVGFDIGRTIEKDLISLNAKGALSFAKGGSGVSALGNFLNNQLGPSGSATKVFGSTRTDPHGYRSGVFAQDDIKLNPDLTLNLGVRYDYLTNPENSLPFQPSIRTTPSSPSTPSLRSRTTPTTSLLASGSPTRLTREVCSETARPSCVAASVSSTTARSRISSSTPPSPPQMLSQAS